MTVYMAKLPPNNNQHDKPERKGGSDPLLKTWKGFGKDGEREARVQRISYPLIVIVHTHCKRSGGRDGF